MVLPNRLATKRITATRTTCSTTCEMAVGIIRKLPWKYPLVMTKNGINRNIQETLWTTGNSSTSPIQRAIIPAPKWRKAKIPTPMRLEITNSCFNNFFKCVDSKYSATTFETNTGNPVNAKVMPIP